MLAHVYITFNVNDTHLSRPASSGTPIVISASKRPARLKAGSKESGLFVAPNIITGLFPVLSHDKSIPIRETGYDNAKKEGMIFQLTIHASQ